MGVDYGGKRVGIALSDETGRFAYPYEVMKNGKTLAQRVSKVCEKERVGRVILGRSLDYKMKPNVVMSRIENFKNELEFVSGLEVIYEDEFLTTAEAERVLGRDGKTDAVAAAIILKSYIDKHS